MKYFIGSVDLDRKDVIQFECPDEFILGKLEMMLARLELSDPVVIDPMQVNKPLKIYRDIKVLMRSIEKDLKENHSDYSKEFEGEPLGFRYYLGRDIYFEKSVEIVQKIYHKTVQMGDLFHSLAVQRFEDRFLYWRW